MFFDHLFFTDESTHTKITNFNGKFLIKQDIIKFYIPVQNRVMMAMRCTFHYLFQNAFGLILADSSCLLDLCEEIP